MCIFFMQASCHPCYLHLPAADSSSKPRLVVRMRSPTMLELQLTVHFSTMTPTYIRFRNLSGPRCRSYNRLVRRLSTLSQSYDVLGRGNKQSDYRAERISRCEELYSLPAWFVSFALTKQHNKLSSRQMAEEKDSGTRYRFRQPLS
jgi:hypothetical protein